MKSVSIQNKSAKSNSILIYASAISLIVLTNLACAPQHNYETINEASGESIVAGTNVSEKDPISASTVAVLIATPFGESTCTGTLIEKNIVATAAHCFAQGASRAIVVFGPDVRTSTTMFQVDRVIVHPGFQSRAAGAGGWNDIALLRFKGIAPVNSKVAEVLNNGSILKRNLKAVAAGYGTTPKDGKGQDSGILRKVTLSLLDPAFEKTELLFPLNPRGGSTCHGDSGGPIYIQQQGRLILIGITSRGSSAACDNVSIFTNVVSHLTFINESVQKLLTVTP